nr:pentatricopeptide repeat-containing protein At3g29230-like [Coffea arabica]XP_027080163.1 pentatricopeptide repeat-containing protein At3g29230-like [Coffea arabica]
MTVRLRAARNSIDLSSRTLEKFIKTQRNLARPTPKLWSDTDKRVPSHLDHDGVQILDLSHPMLRILDSISPNLYHFNQIYTQLVVSGLIQHPLASGRAIKKLCSSQSTLPYAIKIFDNLENPDAFLCNTIIRGYVRFNDPKKALAFYYNGMVKNCIFQNNYTFPILVKACADMGLLEEGIKIHCCVVKCGFELDLFVRNALIHMYSVCLKIWDARKVFDICSESDLVTWNTMIDGYVKNGELGFARQIFDGMHERDVFSWNSMITGYVGVGDMVAAKELFEEMPSRDGVSWNCMIDGYARSGNKDGARMLFDQMDCRNMVSWTSMLALYVRLKDYSECLRLFDEMMVEGDVQPNEAILVSVLISCGHLGRLDRGQWIHSYIKGSERIKPDVLLMTTLLTMFAKCGAMDLAKLIFDEMPERSVVSWNSMIMGYGRQGHGEKALEMFMEMEKCGLMPNDATFTCILSACNHTGMVLEGWWYFDIMHRVYNIEPKIEHYGCMVDLFGRAGLVHDCEELVKTIPVQAGTALWGSVLSACRTYSRLELGQIVAKRLIDMEPGDIGPYVLLSNIYATEGRWDDVENVRKLMKEKGTEKEAGSSLVHLMDLQSDMSQKTRSAHKRSMVYSMLSEMGAQLKLSCRQ